MMFILREEEKKAFLTVVHSFFYLDKRMYNEEEDAFNFLKNELFKIKDFEPLKWKEVDKIYNELKKIKKTMALVYLFNILFEFKEFNKDFSKYIEYIEILIYRIKEKDEILENKLFLYRGNITSCEEYFEHYQREFDNSKKFFGGYDLKLLRIIKKKIGFVLDNYYQCPESIKKKLEDLKNECDEKITIGEGK